MNRLEEINAKHARIQQLLIAHQADSLLLRRTRNIGWFTAGADASIAVDGEYGAYTVLVTAEQRTVVTNNIEATRLRAEENLEALGFEYHVSPWYAPEPVDTPRMIVDEGVVEDDLQALRSVLLPSEAERYRQLGRDAAAALEEATCAVRPGDTEYAIAARLDAACRRYGGLAIVNLVATDGRISQFRHPLPTFKPMERLAMLVVCMRRGGLVVAGTRFAHVGAVPAELEEKAQKVAAIDAAAMVASQPGRTLGEVFDDLIRAYADEDEAGQWTMHHQGGTISYAPRERVATPADATRLQAGMALAWNPSIVGCKSEDTMLLDADGFEIVTQASADFPHIEVEAGGQRVLRPGILEL